MKCEFCNRPVDALHKSWCPFISNEAMDRLMADAEARHAHQQVGRASLPEHVISLAEHALTDRTDEGLLKNVNLTVLADACDEKGVGLSAPEKKRVFLPSGSGTKAVTVACSHCYDIGRIYTGMGWMKTIPCTKCPRETNPLTEHLRSPGPHIFGCWAVMELTGRMTIREPPLVTFILTSSFSPNAMHVGLLADAAATDAEGEAARRQAVLLEGWMKRKGIWMHKRKPVEWQDLVGPTIESLQETEAAAVAKHSALLKLMAKKGGVSQGGPEIEWKVKFPPP